jgi:serine/threonine protein kinase
MKQLFIGLKEMYHNKLIHLDIKMNNIVLDGEEFKYIDFGLSGELNDFDHFERRSLSEFNTKRIYIWYPLEYLYAFIDKSEKLAELFKFNTSSNYRKHYIDGLNIHNIFDLNINNHIKELLKKNDSYSQKDYKDLVSMIDTYSLGIIIPFFFVEYGLIKYIDKSTFLTDIFKLFKSMCKVNHKERMKPGDCLKEYNKLIKKYSYLINKGKKGKKTKRKLK